MSLITTVFLAIGLSMDAFAVSITGGIFSKGVKSLNMIRISSFFSFFQMIMTWLGWFIGQAVNLYFTQYNHWIALLLLLAIGGKMIYESFKEKDNQKVICFDKLTVLFSLSVATSIDAFVAGVGLSVLKIDIYMTILIIGMTTFFLSAIGVKIGEKIGIYIEKYAELIGGLILIFIGIQIFIRYN